MVKLRLKRFGRKKSPFYRVVAINSASKRQGAPLEELGYYDPIRKLLKLNLDHVSAWVSKGAEVSDAVQRLVTLANGRTGEVIELPKREKPALAEKPAAAEQPAEAVEAAIAEKATDDAQPSEDASAAE
ncbi:MAG: 30S ribosomal protein S16 [Vampirovibrionales bacterium]|nr:30S ribosomal protein S16 [Vampirovibrionales bacterium]